MDHFIHSRTVAEWGKIWKYSVLSDFNLMLCAGLGKSPFVKGGFRGISLVALLTPNFSQEDEKEEAKYVKIDLPQ
jgi:hypothetical protein